MILLHLLAGISLFGVTAFILWTSLVQFEAENDAETLVLCGGLIGLTLAIVLFSGFFQIGSQYSPPKYVLYKIGSTVMGGFLGLSGIFGRVKGFVGDVSFVALEGISLMAYGFSFYLALVL